MVEIKKDIILTGKVLNTTARIQGQGNSHRRLNLNHLFKAEPFGEKVLQIREAKMEMFNVHPNKFNS